VTKTKKQTRLSARKAAVPQMILIVTIDDDLHGLAVQACLRRRGVECHILASDTIVGTDCLSIFIGTSKDYALIKTTEGIELDVSNVSLIWLRRPKALQKADLTGVLEESHRNLINNDTSGSISGILESAFNGKWISHPRYTERASNKIIQLTAAKRVGLTIPATLVSQIPRDVLRFYSDSAKQVIVKPIVGTPGPLLFTQMLTPHHLAAEASIRACPAIYQSFIPGKRHIRLNYFRDQAFAFAIDTSELDWRPDLNVPISKWDVPPTLLKRAGCLLQELGLAMGVFDFKESPSGEIFFLEVNPQGQFLFLEGITGEPLTERFVDFLMREANT
jgi:hypothetical protein